MSTKEERIAVFQDTERFYHQNKILSDSIEKSHSGTILYDPDDYPALGDPYYVDACDVTITKNRTFQAAMNLHKQNSESQIAVLNFASATSPGGGVKNGSGAQEECLCRCSTLYAALDRKFLWKKYYDVNRKAHNVLNSDACIYSPGVVIFKTDTDLPLLIKDMRNWITVDVISCAAPNLRKHPYNKYNPQIAAPASLTEEEQYQLHLKRAKHILHITAYHHDDTLVLGAFGCGAFCNSPTAVARAWHDALKEYRHYFVHVEFAVYCKDAENDNYQAFQREFKDEYAHPSEQEKKRTPARRSDFGKLSEMPAEHVTFTLNRKFSSEQLKRLRYGHVPDEMEDKWFFYMEGNVLYAHRSWTGFCQYMVAIFPEGDVQEVIVNRDPEQYTNTDIEFDKKRLNRLLDWWTQPVYDFYSEWLDETDLYLAQSGQIKDPGGKNNPWKTQIKAVHGDITKITDVQVIVNAANKSLLGGGVWTELCTAQPAQDCLKNAELFMAVRQVRRK